MHPPLNSQGRVYPGQHAPISNTGSIGRHQGQALRAPAAALTPTARPRFHAPLWRAALLLCLNPYCLSPNTQNTPTKNLPVAPINGRF